MAAPRTSLAGLQSTVTALPYTHYNKEVLDSHIGSNLIALFCITYVFILTTNSRYYQRLGHLQRDFNRLIIVFLRSERDRMCSGPSFQFDS